MKILDRVPLAHTPGGRGGGVSVVAIGPPKKMRIRRGQEGGNVKAKGRRKKKGEEIQKEPRKLTTVCAECEKQR